MKRICKYCGAEYDGDPGGSCCQTCAAAQRATTIRERVCQACGVSFPGGPRAWYCPDCSMERKRQTAREYQARKRAGTVRKIGSTDLCSVCGKPYTVNSGAQHYCPDCAPEAIRKIDRAASRAWYAANTTPESRREERQAAAALAVCVICGKPFCPGAGEPVACSPVCRQEYKRRIMAQYERDHRAERNTYHRERLQAKLAAMTPEEQRARREEINRKAREAYARRKKDK